MARGQEEGGTGAPQRRGVGRMLFAVVEERDVVCSMVCWSCSRMCLPGSVILVAWGGTSHTRYIAVGRPDKQRANALRLVTIDVACFQQLLHVAAHRSP